MKKIIFILFLVFISGCVSPGDTNVINNICDADNVQGVYDCGDFVEIVNTDDGSRYYTEDGSFNCALTSPSASSQECQDIFNLKKESKVICRNIC